PAVGWRTARSHRGRGGSGRSATCPGGPGGRGRPGAGGASRSPGCRTAAVPRGGQSSRVSGLRIFTPRGDLGRGGGGPAPRRGRAGGGVRRGGVSPKRPTGQQPGRSTLPRVDARGHVG